MYGLKYYTCICKEKMPHTAKNLSTKADSSTAAKKLLSIFFLNPSPPPGWGGGRAKFGSEGELTNERP